MGNTQGNTNGATVLPTSKSQTSKPNEKLSDASREEDDTIPHQTNTKALQTPILLDDDDEIADSGFGKQDSFPVPTGKEYDLIDQIASELPGIIDEESKTQVEDYIAACDKGRGTMVACYSTAEYLSLFLRKHKEAEILYQNTCFRPKNDKSANGVSVDNSKAYAPSCFNLAQMRMTGKGGTKFSRKDGYDLFDRGCRAGHGGSCHMQAKMLTSHPGSLGKGIPYNPKKASNLLNEVCQNGDSLSCFTLATMLLRGNLVSSEAENVTAAEAQGMDNVRQRKNEPSRVKDKNDSRVALERDPDRAEQLLLLACNEREHAPSCYNLAVMYAQGDTGIPVDDEKAKKYKEKTEEVVKNRGGFGFGGSMG